MSWLVKRQLRRDRRGPKLVTVRDSKQRQGIVLSFSPNDWTTFIQGIKAGSSDV
ncbi:DUF397 domain-containing protein [Micromonospora chersina]|uniref:DUF397 domain-containing protein n=1 Tax=Micromonospora chersina TaxID=47854 RepID=UPI0036865DAF